MNCDGPKHKSPDDDSRMLCKKSINLSSSDLTELPADILNSADQSVTGLYVDYNDLTLLPNELCGCLPNLTVISANGNQITFLPESLATLQFLSVLELVENDLVSLPSAICEVKTLQTLRLTGNKLKTLPENFSQLSSLKLMFVEENALKSLPVKLGNLKRLTVLEASNNQLQRLPESLGDLSELQVLNISNNLVADIPDSFEKLSSLVHIDLSMNGIEYLPPRCASLTTLQKFYAECNLLKCLPDWVNHLCDIREFSIKDNHLTQKPLSESFGDTSRKLKLLDIGGNFMSYLPDSLGNLTCLEELHMGSVIDELERRNFQNGNWVAHLPTSFGQLCHLRELHVDENQLRELPSDFGNLVHLEFFDIGQNMLQALPDSFCKLKSLRVCQLSRNSLEKLPSDFGDLESLEDLRLDNNQVCELPESFCRLTKLKSLDLFNNKLTEIPPAVLKLDTLVRLDMGENDFQIPWQKVPQLTIQNRYAPRKPELKDNWRGKVRADVRYDDCKESSIVIEALDLPDEEEGWGLEEAPYSDGVMKRAAERGLSFWRSHDGPQTRPVFSSPAVKPSWPVNGDEDDGWESDTNPKDETDSEDESKVLNGISSDDKQVNTSTSCEDGEHCCENGKTDSDTEVNPARINWEEVLRNRSAEVVAEDSDTEGDVTETDSEDDERDSDSEDCSESDEGTSTPEKEGEDERVLETRPSSPEEDWDEEIENSLGPYDDIKTYQHPPRDHIIMCHEVRHHYFPAWDIHPQPVDWLERMGEPSVVDGQFDDCEEDPG